MKTAERSVVVTGIGMVTPLGTDLGRTLEALDSGKCAVSPVARFGEENAWKAAEVSGFDPRPYFRFPKALKLTDRRTQMAVAAASMAMTDAGAVSAGIDPDRLGVLIGSSGSDLQAEELGRAVADPDHRAAFDVAFFSERVLSGLNPLWLLINLPNMVSAHVAIQLGARGPNSTVMTDWIAGAQALGEGADWILAGEADAVLAGGADTGVLPFVFGGYEQAGFFVSQSSVPGSFALSEGAAVLLLEEGSHAAARGARAYGEFVSYACASVPLPEGALSDTMDQATRAVRARGIRTPAVCRAAVFHEPHWRAEQIAIERVLGDGSLAADGGDGRSVEFRSVLGHALGASGAIDAGLMLARLAASREEGILVNSLGLLGQSATLAYAGVPS
jgi:3-oxoacyl-(acyl-carrier-protein) synthase